MVNTAPWWRDGTIYHIYPRSFVDTNGDGIGDLPGIIGKIPYLRDLGIDAIWMGPIFDSPQVDNGYDIRDYRAVDPRFGSLEDLDRLITTAHTAGIRVLLDLVYNHTSNEHRWFEASRRGEAPYDDYYIWRDGAADGGPPNDWWGFFSLPAWSWDAVRGQYYLHLFTPEQPDLNWENPRVRQELRDVANFWVDRGVDGFRMDVINVVSKAPGLPSLKGAHPSGTFIDGPRMVEFLQEFRRGLHRSEELLLVGETPGITAEAARTYTDSNTKALDMVLLFEHLNLDHEPVGRWDHRPLQIRELRENIATWQARLASPSWPSLYMSNHDQPRIVSRYGNDEQYRFQSATALAALFFLQRGTPILYQGDEIAMRNFPLEHPEQIVDVESHNALVALIRDRGIAPAEAFERVRREARDNSRTPMQWEATPHAGFTTGKPWYPVNPDYPQWNVAAQATAEGSVLSWYRKLLAIRKSHRELTEGTFRELPQPESSTAVVYLREHAVSGASVLVLVNLSDDVATAEIPSTELQLPGTVLLRNYPEPPEVRPGLSLRPWECVVISVKRAGA